MTDFLTFNKIILNHIERCGVKLSCDQLKTTIQHWIASCIENATSGNILLIYNRNYHALHPQWGNDLARRLDFRSDQINGQFFYSDREILNLICQELDTWARQNPEQAKRHHLASSDAGLCIVCPDRDGVLTSSPRRFR